MKNNQLIDKCAHYSLLGHPKLTVLCSVLSSKHIPDGDIVELGVYKGGSAMLLAELFPHKRIHLFDTFSGLPKSNQQEILKEGDFSDTSLESVQQTLKQYSNISYYQGFFPDTANAFRSKIAIAFCDGDYYQSTRNFIDVFWSQLEPKGLMAFDDYGWMQCPGVRRAIEETECFKDCEQWQEDFLYFVIKP